METTIGARTGAGTALCPRIMPLRLQQFFSELWSSLTQSVCTATSVVRAQQKRSRSRIGCKQHLL